MIPFSAIFIKNGNIRRITFEAPNLSEAQSLAAAMGCGLEGAISAPSINKPHEVQQKAYDEKTARQMLGGISRTTLYRLLLRGKLERVKDTRKVLVTHRSIERFCA